MCWSDCVTFCLVDFVVGIFGSNFLLLNIMVGFIELSFMCVIFVLYKKSRILSAICLSFFFSVKFTG